MWQSACRERIHLSAGRLSNGRKEWPDDIEPVDQDLLDGGN